MQPLEATSVRLLVRALMAVISLGTSACTTLYEPTTGQGVAVVPPEYARSSIDSSLPRRPLPGALLIANASNWSVPAPLLVRGSGTGIALPSEIPSSEPPDGEYVLNFEGADLRDVVKAVLGDMLALSYVVDPDVKGLITLHTAKPLSRSAVLPAFQGALKLADATIIAGATGYQVVSLKGAVQKGALGIAGSAFRPGFQIRIVPLKFVSAADVQRVLEPLVAPGTVVSGDPRASLVTLAGTEEEIIRAEQAITTFDVNWLRTQSFGLFPLRYSSANQVAEDLASVVGKDGPLAGAVRIAPIAHLNSILVVSKNYSHVKEMQAWIKQFDRGRDVLKPRLFVYHVQNGRAQDLASVLTKVFAQSRGGSGQGPDDSGGDSASASASSSPPSASGLSPISSAGGLASGFPSAVSGLGSAPFGGLPARDAAASPGAPQQANLRITADEVNNALLIMTTPDRYAQVEAALVQLDAVPMQVLLEASIAEIDVTDSFKYGVQASFQKNGVSTLSSSVAAAALAASTGGLSAAIIKSDIQATLDLLSTLTKVKVISAPKLMVLNNRSASIQVGDQVPIATSTAVSTISANAPTVNTIQLVDTGIILHVTPRVNRSGLVLMDLSQEVSSSEPTVTSSINSPTIKQRRVSTSVAVQDGQTIAIGGLIHDSQNRNRTGIPGLKDMPGLGPLFGVTNDSTDRTELMVLITPRVIRSAVEADAATAELSAELPMLQASHATKIH